MDASVTVVLPVFNNERHLRTAILGLLDLISVIHKTFQIVVVDDGSTDDTYESACELARVYPQVQVLRQPAQRGLASALQLVQDRLAPPMVVAHDGISPIDADQLRSLLEQDATGQQSIEQSGLRQPGAVEAIGSRRFASIRTLHRSMESAHRRINGFSWIQLARPMVPRRRSSNQHIGTPIEMMSIGNGSSPMPVVPGPISAVEMPEMLS